MVDRESSNEARRAVARQYSEPEPLRFYLEGCWSRRITQEHRLVYRIDGDRVHFLQARYHY